MMNRNALAMGVLALIVLPASVMPEPSRSASDTALLRTYTQQLLDAVAPGDKKPWQKLLSPNFVGMDENGAVRTKGELLKEISPLPPGLQGQLRVDRFDAMFDHDLAVVVHEDQEQLSYHGQLLHSRFRSVDSWRRTSAGWRLVGQHTAAVLKDPPAEKVPWSDRCEYAGRYRLDAQTETTIRCSSAGLVASRQGRPDVTYEMEVRDVFFVPGQPRTRRIFQRDAKGEPSGFVDRREGEDVRWVAVK